MNLIDLAKNFLTSIYYLLAKIGFGTAENELRVTPNRLRVLRLPLRAIRVTFCCSRPSHEGRRVGEAQRALHEQRDRAVDFDGTRLLVYVLSMDDAEGQRRWGRLKRKSAACCVRRRMNK